MESILESLFQLRYLAIAVVLVITLMGIASIFKPKFPLSRVITIGGIICFLYMVLFVLSLLFFAVYNSIKSM